MKLKIAREPSPGDSIPNRTTTAAPSIVDILRLYPDFRLLSIGTVGSHAGQWILNIALAWLILELTDSALYVGMLGFAAGIPMVLASVPSGILLDRVNRRLALLACQAGMLVVVGGLIWMIIVDLATPWWLLAGMFVYGALMALNNAGRQTIVPATVPRRAMPAAFGLTSAATHASRIVGPSIAGLLIGVWGVSAALVFQASLLVVALVATQRMSTDAGSETVHAPGPGGYLEGFSYLRQRKLVRDLAILAAIPMFFAFPYLQLLPVIARDILGIGPDGLGLMLAMSGVGAIAGGLLTGRVAAFKPHGLIVLVGTIAYGGIVLVVALSTNAWLTIGAIMIGSMTGSMFQSLNNTLFQLELDDRIRGRATGVYMLGFGAYALGGLPLGFLADTISVPVAIGSGAVVSSALATVLLVRSPHLRNLRKSLG